MLLQHFHKVLAAIHVYRTQKERRYNTNKIKLRHIKKEANFTDCSIN